MVNRTVQRTGTQPMYKATYAGGDSWYEWLKMGASQYLTYKVHGDGSITPLDTYSRVSLARAWVQSQNHTGKGVTEGGLYKIANSLDGEKYLSSADLKKWRVPEWPDTDAGHEWLKGGSK